MVYELNLKVENFSIEVWRVILLILVSLGLGGSESVLEGHVNAQHLSNQGLLLSDDEDDEKEEDLLTWVTISITYIRCSFAVPLV